MSTEPRLEHQTTRIKQLVEDYQTGRIVIPEFQREYVWRPSKAPRLIDSLYRGFPISSLLLWQSTEQTRARRGGPQPQRSAVMHWLIDGQQRIITLSRTKTGDQGIDVVFHPDSEEFRLANAVTRQDPNWFHVSDLWDDVTYRRVRHNLDGTRNEAQQEARLDAVRRILDYTIPVVQMIDHSFDDAVEAFTRINTLGVRLKADDIQSAKIAARHSGFIADEVTPFLKSLHSQGFRRLNVMHLFRACAFVATPDGRNRTPLHEMKRQDVLSAWKTTVRATERTVGLIRAELGLVNMDILWSGALVVPLIAICAKMPPRELDQKELAGWLLLAALCHRYSGSSETALDQDLLACRHRDPVGALLANLRKVRSPLAAKEKDFAGTLADRGGLLALYVACLNRGLLDFYKGGKVILQNDVDRHHILPRAQFSERKRPSADNIANMAFITGPVNKSIGLTGPEVYLKTVKPQIVRSQCIPTDSSTWRIDRAEWFWMERRKLLTESFNDKIRKLLSQRHM